MRKYSNWTGRSKQKKCAHFSSGLQLLLTHGVFSITNEHKEIIKKVLAIAAKRVLFTSGPFLFENG